MTPFAKFTSELKNILVHVTLANWSTVSGRQIVYSPPAHMREKNAHNIFSCDGAFSNYKCETTASRPNLRVVLKSMK